ncbi:MAG: 1-acyl-sn-glycerol-3-phosphate acyltransferase [Treponema sp.]|jgi:1-acyl-sn-glycerol-3-phosphate acyltransferase|nr:1-acyl-sn-glycerol-3-phosphate acyltransferase [Treponema sp.]
MPYKHGRPLIDNSPAFRLASAMTFYAVWPIAQIFNLFQYSTSYENRRALYRYKKAILVVNHTTFFDPVKTAGAVMPFRVWQTMLEATVEFPFLGTFTRLLGGMPIPRGKNSLKTLLDSASAVFRHYRYWLFYPEGECYLYNQRLRAFRPGAFYLSAELDVPVIPMVTVFSEGREKPFTPRGRVFPKEKLVILDAVYPSRYIRRGESGELIMDSVREYTEVVRRIMQDAIDKRGGSNAFYRGRMERIKGLND